MALQRQTGPLTRQEIESACAHYPPIVTPAQLAEITGVSASTLYQWISQGRLDGSFRKRGKRVLIWRDREIAILFDGPAWRSDADKD